MEDGSEIMKTKIEIEKELEKISLNLKNKKSNELLTRFAIINTLKWVLDK